MHLDLFGSGATQKVERVIGVLLQTGVLLSILVALGLVSGAPAIVAAALAGRREAVIQLGVVILIATPIARVLLSLVAFALQRDRTYVVVTLIVLVVLLSGLFGVGP